MMFVCRTAGGICVDRGGIVGDDGKTHQGIFDLSFLSLIPNMIVAAPQDENELQHMLYTAVKSGKIMACVTRAVQVWAS